MLRMLQNGGSWFGLDNKPQQFVRNQKWWGGAHENMGGAVQWSVAQRFDW